MIIKYYILYHINLIFVINMNLIYYFFYEFLVYLHFFQYIYTITTPPYI